MGKGVRPPHGIILSAEPHSVVVSIKCCYTGELSLIPSIGWKHCIMIP